MTEPNLSSLSLQPSSQAKDTSSTRSEEPSPSRSQEISLPLPRAPHTTLHIKLQLHAKTTILFLTSTDYMSSGTSSALGSFVYAMPNRLQPTEPFCTPLVSIPESLEFATRVAKIVARRSGKPTFVGCSVAFGGADVEDQIEGTRAVVGKIMEVLEGE